MHIVEERWKQSQVGSYDGFPKWWWMCLIVWFTLSNFGNHNKQLETKSMIIITRLYAIRGCLTSLGCEEFLPDGRGSI